MAFVGLLHFSQAELHFYAVEHVLVDAAGDGIGPDIAEAVKTVFSAAKAPIVWEEQVVGTTVDTRTNSMVSRENLDSVLVSPASSAVPCLLHSAC